MKRQRHILLAIFLGLVLPTMLLRCNNSERESAPRGITIAVLAENEVIKMDLETYLTGVLLCEMPADFEEEALKAQAVAARTFVLYQMENGSKHADADVCTLANCCQGYKDPEVYVANGGAAADALKIYGAINATEGEVLVFDGKLIEATYFSSSGGKTEDAEAVWGKEVPYLVSVESEEPDSTYVYEIGKEDFCDALGLSNSEIQIELITYTPGGGVAQIRINGKTFTGSQLRTSLGLRSTQMQLNVGEDLVEIVTNGYGHRVGMSQYGADAMACGGSDYRQILMHYYTGVSVLQYTMNNN